MGPKPSGEATRVAIPVMEAARANERQTLLASPTYAKVRPAASAPKTWRSVSRSARAWHGWARSESRLTTGTGTPAASRASVIRARVPCSMTRAHTTAW